MNRRSFLLGLASALVLPEPPRVRAYSFMPGTRRIWSPTESLDITISPIGIFLNGQRLEAQQVVHLPSGKTIRIITPTMGPVGGGSGIGDIKIKPGAFARFEEAFRGIT